MSSPTSPLDAISADDEVSPAAPRSCSATSSPRSSSSSEHSSTFFSANGSPTWTVGRLAASSSPSSADASTDAPPIPSRPVDAPNRTSALPMPVAALRMSAVRAREPERHRVDEAVLLVGLLEVDLAADRRHADRVAVVADPADGVVEQVAACAPTSARRSAASRARRSAARRSRRCRAGCRRRRSPRPETARPPTGGCATRP